VLFVDHSNPELATCVQPHERPDGRSRQFGFIKGRITFSSLASMSASQVTSGKDRFALIPVTYSPDWNFKDHVATFSIEMILIHNIFIRSLNSIYHCAPVVKKEDETAFAGYCLTFAENVRVHHDMEEEIVFPFLQTKFDMGANVEQHAQTTSGIRALEEYMNDVLSNKTAYDGAKVRELVEGFGDDLVEHLHDEVCLLRVRACGIFKFPHI